MRHTNEKEGGYLLYSLRTIGFVIANSYQLSQYDLRYSALRYEEYDHVITTQTRHPAPTRAHSTNSKYNSRTDNTASTHLLHSLDPIPYSCCLRMARQSLLQKSIH